MERLSQKRRYSKDLLYPFLMDLLFTAFDNLPIQTEFKQVLEKHDYLRYAANHWVIHLKNAQGVAEHRTLQSVLKICNTQSQRFQSTTVASYFGLESMVELLLNVDSKGYCGRTPLLWAAMNGHQAVVTPILATGKVDVDS